MAHKNHSTATKPKPVARTLHEKLEARKTITVAKK